MISMQWRATTQLYSGKPEALGAIGKLADGERRSVIPHPGVGIGVKTQFHR